MVHSFSGVRDMTNHNTQFSGRNLSVVMCVADSTLWRYSANHADIARPGFFDRVACMFRVGDVVVPDDGVAVSVASIADGKHMAPRAVVLQVV